VQELKGFAEAVPEISKRVFDLAEQLASPVVLIDGRAGSGKTTLAKLVQESLFANGLPVPRVLSMDELYPGWEGLRQGAAYLVDKVLLPISQNRSAHWQNWDWEQQRRGGPDIGNGHRSFEPGGILIVEGCGSLSEASKSLSNLSIFIERSEADRKKAISERDGDRFDAYWEIWLAQEQEFYQSEASDQIADIRILN
jgi:uridine kinase